MQALILLPERQCEGCTALQKSWWGCEAEATKPITMDGEVMTRCPRRILLDRPQWVGEIWWLYSRYVDGILPEPGGLNNQPAKYIAVVRLLESAKSAATSEKEARENRLKAHRERASHTFNSG